MITLVLLVLGVLSTTEGAGTCGYGKQILKSGGLTIQEKQAIVDAHNRLRQSVALGQVSSQPPAANMMEMVWDEELAATAQRWADQCTPAHDSATQREVQRWPVGQNLAATWTTRPPSGPEDETPDFMKQIKAWFDEVRIFGFRPISGNHGTGHYSQLVWGETTHVGCGFTFYYDPSRGYTKLYVCNYGPGGNVIGANPYDKGYPSCSNYGLAESRKYSGLCSTTRYTSTSSYQQVNNQNNLISNVIPDSNNDGYYSYYNEYENQRQQYDPPTVFREPSVQVQSVSEVSVPPVLIPFTIQTEASTFRPLISLFKRASDLLTKPKSKGTSFRFGTLYS